MVANKTDLCFNRPPPLPNVEYGQAVHADPTSSPDDNDDDDDTADETDATATTARPELRPRAVSATEGAMFAKEHGLLYVETSAKEGWHVVDAFEWTAREVLATVSRAELDRRKVSHYLHPSSHFVLNGTALTTRFSREESKSETSANRSRAAAELGRRQRGVDRRPVPCCIRYLRYRCMYYCSLEIPLSLSLHQ